MRSPLFCLSLDILPFEPTTDAYTSGASDSSDYLALYDVATTWVSTKSERSIYIETVVPSIDFDERLEFDKLLSAFYNRLIFSNEGNDGIGVLNPDAISQVLVEIQGMNFVNWAYPESAKEIEDSVILIIEFLIRSLFHNKTVFFTVSD